MNPSCRNPEASNIKWKFLARNPRTKRMANPLEKYRPIPHLVSVIRTDRKARLSTAGGI